MQFNIPIKRIFLIDGIGALITAILLSMVLANFEDLFGMPRSFLYPLASAASIFAIYSLSCSLWVKESQSKYLIAIAIANLSYSFVTLFLVFYLFEQLTWLGVVYFIGEIIIVVGLAVFEINFSLKHQ